MREPRPADLIVIYTRLVEPRVPLAARFCYHLGRGRACVRAAKLSAVAAVLAGFYLLVIFSAGPVTGYLADRFRPRPRAALVLPGRVGAPAVAGARYLPSYEPAKIWLVEQKEGYEKYSNGGRIVTTYETESHPRSYYARVRGAEPDVAEVQETPVGIVYHTSESDIVPFTADNNGLMKTRTQGLLEHVQRSKCYNYVIDRFGEIYRVVRDDHAAAHAGHSVWADDERFYVGLNESFIGICFESSSAADALDEQLTEAQLIAGRALTAVLRSKYGIKDLNCTTHALVSVNPQNMMIALHRDWVRNFPFEAMGLSDKYLVPLASITEFGFWCDTALLRQLGGAVWPGAAKAQEQFRQRAGREQTSAGELRRRLRERYLAEFNLERQLRFPSPVETAAAGAR